MRLLMDIIAVSSLNHCGLTSEHVGLIIASDFTYKNMTSHFICPDSPLCSLQRLISMLCNANVVVPFVLDTHLNRKAPVHGNPTTWTHSPRGLMSQAICLLGESQEPEVVSDRFYYVCYSQQTFISPSNFPCLLSTIYTVREESRNPCAISLFNSIIWRLEIWRRKETKDTTEIHLSDICALQRSCSMLHVTCTGILRWPTEGLKAQDASLSLCWKYNKYNMWSVLAFRCFVWLFAI